MGKRHQVSKLISTIHSKITIRNKQCPIVKTKMFYMVPKQQKINPIKKIIIKTYLQRSLFFSVKRSCPINIVRPAGLAYTATGLANFSWDSLLKGHTTLETHWLRIVGGTLNKAKRITDTKTKKTAAYTSQDTRFICCRTCIKNSLTLPLKLLPQLDSIYYQDLFQPFPLRLRLNTIQYWLLPPSWL